MKKLSLKALELGAKELLTRAQLTNVLGGSGGLGNCDNECDYNWQCWHIAHTLCESVPCLNGSTKVCI